MEPRVFVLALLCLCAAANDEADKKKPTKLQIGVKKRVEDCDVRSKKGDVLHMHYTIEVGRLRCPIAIALQGTLDDGTEFDSSLKRDQPLTFTLGTGQVIKGWDQGLLNMCEGEKRKLVIPPDLGYGANGAGAKIPGNAVLHFDVELIKIERKSEL